MGHGGGFSSSSFTENEYIQGAMLLNVYDGKSTELLWNGVANKTVEENPQKREKSIPKTVKKLLKKFPVKPVK